MSSGSISHNGLDTLREMSQGLNIAVPTGANRDVLCTLIYLAKKNIQACKHGHGPPSSFSNTHGKQYNVMGIKDLQKEIYERISGTGSEMARDFLHLLQFLDHREALVTLLLTLDGVKIWRFSTVAKNAKSTHGMSDPRLRSHVFCFMLNVAWSGLPAGFSLKSHQLKPRPTENTTTTFLQFPQFPPELRFKIWEFAALSGPRVIKLHIYKGAVKTTCPPPAFLHANAESRKECMNKFDKIYALNDSASSQYIYFNPENDTLAIGRRHALFNKDDRRNTGLLPSLLTLLPQSVLDGAKNIALGREAFRLGASSPHDIGELIAFTAMKKLSWIQEETNFFEPHHVVLAEEQSPNLSWLESMRAELVAAYVDDNRVIDDEFIISEVKEINYKV